MGAGAVAPRAAGTWSCASRPPSSSGPQQQTQAEDPPSSRRRVDTFLLQGAEVGTRARIIGKRV